MKNRNHLLTLAGCATICGTLVFAARAADGDATDGTSERGVGRLLQDVPHDFPRFGFAGHSEQAQLLSHYLWYHLYHRGGPSLTLFNKEYLLTADIWLGNASPRGATARIQDVHRGLLLGVRIDGEGYVSSHQHFSHAHDLGWPFPTWAQVDSDPDKVKGKAVGWHFQPLDQVPGWVGGLYLRRWKKAEYAGQTAASLWELANVKSLGIQENRWRLQATGPSPTLLSPRGYTLDAVNAPYLQLRWRRVGTPRTGAVPYVEWLRATDQQFSPDRRVYFYPEKTSLSHDCWHSIMTMYRHPQWKGKIKRVRICLAPGPCDDQFEIDSFFTVYDTRHTINNPILILASCRYFNWTGDLDFLRRQINRLRQALRYQQSIMGGLQFNRIRNPWPGHDGLPGWTRTTDGTLTMHPGHGIGSNYWDILPFGWDDAYATNQYYAATIAMADLEQAIAQHPGWDIPRGALKLDPESLRQHARQVKETANRLFWDGTKRRFIACIDKHGDRHDYGYTFLNLDAIWYGLATEEHARAIMDWISGRRVIVGDTSTGADIYRWRFGPRATTVRNIQWYCQGWYDPASLPWGGQVQDGGAVLGFTFYDLWARLRVFGPDDAWQRLQTILEWEKEVQAAGGYRRYYDGGTHGTTLQGGGTCGGLGIDCEFYESSLLPAIIPYGFVGLDARPDGRLAIAPRLPKACPEMSVHDMLYHNVRFDIRVTRETIELDCKDVPLHPIHVLLQGDWTRAGTDWHGSDCVLDRKGAYRFERAAVGQD